MRKIKDLDLKEAALALDAYLEDRAYPNELEDLDKEEVISELKRGLEENQGPFIEIIEIHKNRPRYFRQLLLDGVKVPSLNFSDRKGDWDLLSQSLRDSMVQAYLFDGLTLRELDENFLLLDSSKTRGFESLVILRHLGITGEFKGLYKGFKLEEAITSLKTKGLDYQHLVEALQRFGYSLYREEAYSENDNLKSQVRDGGSYLYYSTKYERSPYLRKEAIDYHGCVCMACGFNFEEVYGDLGRDFIEVHHLVGFHDLAQDQIVDVRTDMVTLCSNCHRMVHRKRTEILSLEQLRKIIDEVKNNG